MKTINGMCVTEVREQGKKVLEKKNKNGFEKLTPHEKNILIAYVEMIEG